MFDIEYKGANCIVITTKKATVIADPNISALGLKVPKLDGSVVIATEQRFALYDETTKLVVDGPGEYEVADFSIRGIPVQRHIDTADDIKACTVYRIEIGDVRIALLGNIDPKVGDEVLEQLGVVDILVIPVGGGGYTIDPTEAATLCRKIDAKTIIPVHYADSAVNYEVPQEPLAVFYKELGGDITETAKLKVKSASSLPLVLTTVEVQRT